MSEADIAWAAGLFEGEGCIYCKYERDHRDNQDYLRIRLSLQMVDEDIVRRFCSIIGGKVSENPANLPSGKQAWQWNMHSQSEFIRVINLFLPYFGERRKNKALESLSILESKRLEGRKGHSEQGKRNIAEGVRKNWEKRRVLA